MKPDKALYKCYMVEPSKSGIVDVSFWTVNTTKWFTNMVKVLQAMGWFVSEDRYRGGMRATTVSKLSPPDIEMQYIMTRMVKREFKEIGDKELWQE